MKIYVTRHGQVGKKTEFYQNNPFYTIGEVPLSDLGRQQAHWLAAELKKRNFHGRIYASPFLRTMDTADIIAADLGTVIYPYGPIHEIIRGENANTYKGSTLENLKTMFTHIAPDAELPYPWWDIGVDENMTDHVCPRVKAGMDALMSEWLARGEDVLCVGHGASCYGMYKALEIHSVPGMTDYNCSLSMMSPDEPDTRQIFCDTSFMPYDMVTNNPKYRKDVDWEAMHAEWEKDLHLPAEIADLPAPKILHIGDTYSAHYPYYKKLIAAVKPDIILHTGDLADEVKVGRIPNQKEEYLSKIAVLADILGQSGARVIICAGNNDLPEEIAHLMAFAEIAECNSVVELDGVPCRIGHAVSRMTFDTQYCFYGHGLTGETWTKEQNKSGSPCRFNASWGSVVIVPSQHRFIQIARP